MIDLFKLHDDIEDKGAYSWIVVDGPEVFDNFQLLIKKIIEDSNCSIKSLSREVSKKIGCSTSMLYDILNGRTPCISLALISDLLAILRAVNADKATELKNKFLHSIKFLKSNPRSTVRIKAVKKLSTELAEFCGIHAADGSLNLAIDIESNSQRNLTEIKNKLSKEFPELKISKIRGGRSKDKYAISFYVIHKTRAKVLSYLNKHSINYSIAYKLEFIDFSRSSMEYLRELISNLFEYQIKIRHRETGEGHYALFSNKIMGRYLKNLFGFPIGKKSDTVEAPELIKKAPFSIQKAFTRGFIQFDGSVKRKGTIAFSTNSKKLLNFFLNILRKDRIRGAGWVRKRRKKELGFESSPTKQWLSYFIKGTLKYQRLYEYIYGFKEVAMAKKEAIKVFDKAFPPSSRSTLAFAELIKKASKLGEFTNYQILNKLNVNYRTLLFMLRILEKAGVIKVDRVKMLERIEGKRDKITFTSDIKKWRVPYVYG